MWGYITYLLCETITLTRLKRCNAILVASARRKKMKNNVCRRRVNMFPNVRKMNITVNWNLYKYALIAPASSTRSIWTSRCGTVLHCRGQYYKCIWFDHDCHTVAVLQHEKSYRWCKTRCLAQPYNQMSFVPLCLTRTKKAPQKTLMREPKQKFLWNPVPRQTKLTWETAYAENKKLRFLACTAAFLRMRSSSGRIRFCA